MEMMFALVFCGIFGGLITREIVVYRERDKNNE